MSVLLNPLAMRHASSLPISSVVATIARMPHCLPRHHSSTVRREPILCSVNGFTQSPSRAFKESTRTSVWVRLPVITLTLSLRQCQIISPSLGSHLTPAVRGIDILGLNRDFLANDKRSVTLQKPIAYDEATFKLSGTEGAKLIDLSGSRPIAK